MLTKDKITTENFESLKVETARLREDTQKQEEALEDIRVLREYALDRGMPDEVVQLYLEESLIHQHSYMEKAEPEALANMKRAVEMAGDYVAKNKMVEWESRIHRFLGRVADYEKKYQEAADYYKKAIAEVALDPKFGENRALAFEYRGFLILDDLRLGDTKAAVAAAEKLYDDYESTAEGAELKARDFTTWAVWRSGVYINLCRALIDMGLLEEYRDAIVKWLDLAESNFQAPDGAVTWSDFGFRKNEIIKVRDVVGGVKQ
ncbi:hypothetical protein A3K29_04555 [Candidatus Collierbacteria bacterium RIFOXYB2_FULL_46_14]|uniref:Uncharacterized protein n=1 Tax=Candidatus Collierbacteria bacterium GW2011_GWA2_46_26 TaxID=1618381 RepID=A0A0G1PKA1_9BACT|nr:MAG: hypothetical protein UW29_C0005G0015 [Candidatus Collierbacteria bacterium GW2011_GWC2_44_13]KKU33151.1 MAG: hypothetical protein UX47_C0006G0122 [Candidatus Collierbacteria bacterium GW2011_GWA2_46_26]OGD73370.1 MAG: hypothetical protein A3K29_04555 [Candidatus Collierbacteria bacterium RIFOXYB2_FULL_46_14]OGD76412.1 MAG: hypothetical protein A3K43_04555 [Candidatus Collierbacteria bacterium RIFOXYA2_FULL_46_20]OGD77748.1 MAG: hypothetical protein A3K39_04555 [Candidatus Collierbacteri